MNLMIYKANGELMGCMREREDEKIYRIMVKRSDNDFVVASYISGQREWFGGHYFDGPNSFNQAKAYFMYNLMETMPSDCIGIHHKAHKMVRKLWDFLSKIHAQNEADDQLAGAVLGRNEVD